MLQVSRVMWQRCTQVQLCLCATRNDSNGQQCFEFPVAVVTLACNCKQQATSHYGVSTNLCEHPCALLCICADCGHSSGGAQHITRAREQGQCCRSLHESSDCESCCTSNKNHGRSYWIHMGQYRWPSVAAQQCASALAAVRDQHYGCLHASQNDSVLYLTPLQRKMDTSWLRYCQCSNNTGQLLTQHCQQMASQQLPVAHSSMSASGQGAFAKYMPTSLCWQRG
jgi:hypothetical protein